jgi:cytochrome P450
LKEEAPPLSGAADCRPVKVERASGRVRRYRAMWEARRNLLAVWSPSAYSNASFDFRFLRQHYFVCNSPDSVRRVFLDAHDNYDRKSPQMRHALEPLLGDGLFVSDGELWQARRAHCTPAFDSDLLPGFADVMARSARELAADWERAGEGAGVDMLNQMARLTARIIGRTLFGDEVADAEAAEVVRGFSDYQRDIDQMSLADSLGLPWLRGFGNPLRRVRAARAAQRVQAVIDRIIERRHLAGDASRRTLLSLLIDGDSDGRSGGACPLSPTAARNEAIVMFMAGHETTANSLAWTWYLLDHCPRAAARLHEELDRVLGGRDPEYDDIQRLPYTRAVFEEAMRLYPPVPLLSRQARASDTIHDARIEPGSIILVVPWLLHRHVRYWDAPDSFRPERFLPDAPRPDKFVYIPFSVGRRVCLGMRFGLTEGILCLATLARRFRPSLRPDHRVDIECRLTLRPEGGLPMRLERR